MHIFTYFTDIQYVKYCAVEGEFFSFRIVGLIFFRNSVYESAGCELNILHKMPLEILYTVLWSTCFQMLCILSCLKDLHVFSVTQHFRALNWSFSYTLKPRERYVLSAKN